jgi:hypothetical protein
MNGDLITSLDDERVDLALTFALSPEQIPSPPRSKRYADRLRWALCVMEPVHPSLPFIAGVFSHCLSKGGLTGPQAKVASEIIIRLEEAYWEELENKGDGVL